MAIKEKIKIEIEVDQEIAADYQAMLDDINSSCKDAHDQSRNPCIPLTISNCSESNMKSQLTAYAVRKAYEKYT